MPAARPPAKSVRQSVTIPPSLAVAVRRVARERRVTMSRALVALAEKGVQADAEGRWALDLSYDRFVNETNPRRKSAAGRDLIRSIFGNDAIAENSVF